MKKFCPMRLTVFFMTFIFGSTTLSSQVLSSKADYTHHIYEKVLNLGSNGIAVIGSDPSKSKDVTVVRFDSTSKQMWEKVYTLTSGNGRTDFFANSADGNDIYVLSFKTIEKKEGGATPSLVWIDAKSGDSKQKEFPEAGFGYVYAMYANSNYFFVYTTSLPLNRKEIEKTPVKTKLYRFEKATMEMVLLDDEMKDASAYPRVFWQIFRVENEYVEAYVIKEATQHIVVTMARFDNDGKKIKSADVAFDLKETFPRQAPSSIPLNAGISNGLMFGEKFPKEQMHNSVFIDPDLALIFPLASCQLHFDPVSKTYYAYGICGHDEKQGNGNFSSEYSGFYIGHIDADYKLVAFKEHAKVPLLQRDVKFNKGEPGDRSIHVTRTSTDPLVIFVNVTEEKEYYFSMDPVDLSIKKPIALKIHRNNGEYSEYMPDTFTSSLDKELYWDPEVVKSNTFNYQEYYIPTARWQYVVLVSFEKEGILVFTSPMK